LPFTSTHKTGYEDRKEIMIRMEIFEIFFLMTGWLEYQRWLELFCGCSNPIKKSNEFTRRFCY
jgi:hypothetical protein